MILDIIHHPPRKQNYIIYYTIFSQNKKDFFMRSQ
nr:MAG TPA: hypothetical protein [Caudoviricetes sp.]